MTQGCGQGAWISSCQHYSTQPLPIMANKGICQGLAGWVGSHLDPGGHQFLINRGVVPTPLKEAVIHPFLKKPNLDPGLVINYRPVANFPFLGKVLEHLVADQLQAPWMKQII